MKKKKIQYSNIIAIIFILSSIYIINAVLLFDKIETFLRYLGVAIIAIIDLYLLFRMFCKKKKKKRRRIIYSIILILLSALFIYVGSHLNTIYSYFADFNKKVVYSTSLVTLKDKKEVNLSKLKDAKIGISNEGDMQNLSKNIIDKYKLDKNNQLIDYESNSEMILELYNNKLDYIFLPTNFVDIYGSRDEFEGIGDKLKIIDSEQKEFEKEEVHLSGSSKDVSEPFTMLLFGIDSTVDGLQNADSFNGDSLIVITFNPKTFNITMLSIPRDSYVPVTCMNNVDNKITHSAGQGGTNCVIKTVQNFLDIKVDYFAKINFKGVVELVDALGGVEIDVPYPLCEQNSKRQFGANMVYIEAGKQVLNGEQALAYSRNRKNNSNYCPAKYTQGERSDFVRAAHQQEVIQAIVDKLKTLSSIEEAENILKVVSKNFDTNMKQTTIFSFYNVFKDVLISSSSDKAITIQKLYLDGTGQMIYDERSKLVLWDYILNKKSLAAVKQAMKDNLKGTKQEMIKKFSYTIGEEYKTKVIGEGYSGTERYDLLIDLTGKTITEAEKWATNHNLSLEKEYVTSTKYGNNTVIEQEYPVSKRIDLIPNKTMKVKVVQNEVKPVKVDCETDEDNEICKLPNLKGKKSSDFDSWANSYSTRIDRVFDNDKEGTIVKIEDDNGNEIKTGTKVKDMLGKKIHVVMTEKQTTNESNTQEENQNNNNNNTNPTTQTEPDNNENEGKPEEKPENKPENTEENTNNTEQNP